MLLDIFKNLKNRKLYKYGITGNTLHWIQSYPQDKTQFVILIDDNKIEVSD